MIDKAGHTPTDRMVLAGSHWDRYNTALASSLTMLRDAAEIALVLAEIEQERTV